MAALVQFLGNYFSLMAAPNVSIRSQGAAAAAAGASETWSALMECLEFAKMTPPWSFLAKPAPDVCCADGGSLARPRVLSLSIETSVPLASSRRAALERSLAFPGPVQPSCNEHTSKQTNRQNKQIVHGRLIYVVFSCTI